MIQCGDESDPVPYTDPPVRRHEQRDTPPGIAVQKRLSQYIHGDFAQVALVNAGVRDLYEVPIEGHQDRRAHVQLLHVPGLAGHLDQVAGLKRPLYAEEDAGQEAVNRL